MSELLLQYDTWLKPGGPSALVIKEFLEPAAGKGAVIFPPTFAQEEGSKEKAGYVIDGEKEDSSCLIDTVGAQANRLEPIFLKADFRQLVPQIDVQIGERSVSILEAGHRAADAVVRSTSLQSKLRDAFRAYDSGDAEPMAKLAPTSLVFGAWDSRDTQIKIPRLLESTVRASNIDRFRRSAQYFAALTPEEVVDSLEMSTGDKGQKDALSTEGFLDSPTGFTHGGIKVKGEILRTAILNLTALRSIGAKTEERTLAVRRYTLALALIAAAARDDFFFRQGCILVQDAEKPAETTIVHRDGQRQTIELDLAALTAFAAEAAAAFGVGPNESVVFDPAAAKALMEKRAEKKQKKTK